MVRHRPAVNQMAQVSRPGTLSSEPNTSDVIAKAMPPARRSGPKGWRCFSSAARITESPMGWMDV